jgi:O-antigen ligase
MHAVSNTLGRLTSLGFWGGVCALFALLVGSGNAMLAAAYVCLMLMVLLVLTGPGVIAALWLMGSPTVFPIGDQVISSLPFITLDRVMFVTVTGLIVLGAIFEKRGQRAFMGIEKIIVMFLAYTLINLCVSTTSDTVRQDIWFYLQYAMPMLMFFSARRINWDERGIRLLLACLTLTGVVVALLGLAQKLLGISFLTPNVHVTAGHEDRASGMFSNAHTYIATLFILLTLTVFQLGMYRDAAVRFVLLSAMGVMAIAMVLGETRAPWGGAGLGLFIIMCKDPKVRPFLFTSGVVAAIGGAVFAFLMLDEIGSFMQRVTDLDTLAGRLATWATAVNMIVHNPVFGVGFGADAFELHKPEYITGIGSLPQQAALYLSVPHDEYLHVTVLLGLTGLTLFLCILFGVVRLMFNMHADDKNTPLQRRLCLYAGATIVGLMFNSLFSDTYVQNYFWLLAYFLAGLAVQGGRGGSREAFAVAHGARRFA